METLGDSRGAKVCTLTSPVPSLPSLRPSIHPSYINHTDHGDVDEDGIVDYQETRPIAVIDLVKRRWQPSSSTTPSCNILLSHL
jgi:hypothetical protein